MINSLGGDLALSPEQQFSPAHHTHQQEVTTVSQRGPSEEQLRNWDEEKEALRRL